MPAVWWKRSLHCKSETGDVHDPNTSGKNLSKISSTRKPTTRSGCSRSIANIKDVIHGSKRHMENLHLQSPRSVGSCELLNPITHQVVLNNSSCELKITGYCFQNDKGSGNGSAFLGTIKPGTPVPVTGSHCSIPPRKPKGSDSPLRKGSSNNQLRRARSRFGSRSGASTGGDSNDSQPSTCHKCGEEFSKCEAVESHHLSKHAVTQLLEGDSSRNIVEMICRTNWSSKSDNNNNNNKVSDGIERILKVHNMQRTLTQFEEYCEMVKTKANKLAKKHARCLADGNELLRFHGTTLECCLGMKHCSGLCTSDKCGVCQILTHGFKINGGIGVFTASTSSRALEAIKLKDDRNPGVRKALIVCRVIAGRVHKPLENVEEIAGQSGFDSLAGKVGLNSSIEELFLLSPTALLPCFVVICKP